MNPFYDNFQGFKMCFGSALEWKQNLLNFFVQWSHVKTIFAWEGSEIASVGADCKYSLIIAAGDQVAAYYSENSSSAMYR